MRRCVSGPDLGSALLGCPRLGQGRGKRKPIRQVLFTCPPSFRALPGPPEELGPPPTSGRSASTLGAQGNYPEGHQPGLPASRQLHTSLGFSADLSFLSRAPSAPSSNPRF